MNATSINASPVHRHTGAMTKLTGLIFAALLLPAVPASAAGFVTRDPVPASRLADADANGPNGCALPRLSLRFDGPLVLRPGAGQESAGDLPKVENQWAQGATSEWNAGLNLAVDRLVSPPDHVNVYATQTADRLSDDFGGPRVSNETLAGFKIVFH